MNTVRTALYVSTAVVALGLGGYLAGLFGPTEPDQPAAALTTPPGAEEPAPAAVPAPGSTTPDTTAAPATPTAPQPDAAASDTPAPAPTLIPPSFDIVRVEPDGSIVIAGKAAANSSIEIIAGSPVLGSTKAGPEGDFAAVLTEALKPGNYEIVLRATGPDGVVTMSVETAIVSIPDNEKGEVLALVEQPGEPSRLITVPEPAAPTGEAQPPAAEPSGTQQAAEAPPASETPPVSETPAAAPEQPAATPPATAEAPASATEAPATPSTAEAPTAPVTEPAAPGQPATPAEASPQVAAVDPQPETKEQEAAEPQRLDTVAIEAVEIEGRLIFVAGRATARSVVRVYANDILIGESRASEASRFLVEAERDLPVGDYIIRADMLAADGATVLARAAVPFTREEGEFVAAVAPPAGTSEPETPAPSAPAASPQASEPATTPAPSAPTNVTEPAATQAVPTEQAAALPAEPATPPAASGDNAAEPTPAPAQSTSSEPRPPVPFLQPAEPAVPPAAPVQPAPADVAATPATQAEPASAELAPKLQSVKSAVIIRRGDSLWRISRRVYGRGIRYSTIYLANQDQIQDPDRIWPGQVFKVPEKSGAGEAADMSKVGDQAVTTSN